MYLRAVHSDATLAELRLLIRSNPLGILTTAIASKSYPKILSSHIPFILDDPATSDKDDFGILRGHLARANPQTKTMIDEVKSRTTNSIATYLEEEVLVLFTSSTQHYVTPKFYTSTKPDTGKVVPTWNYAGAQVYGRAKIFYDAKSEETNAFLSKQIDDLSKHAESSLMGFDGQNGRQKAWGVSDAPVNYIEQMKKAIIGIEIKIDRLEGKFKMSQELADGDRDGTVEGFQNLGTGAGEEMARLVEERGRLKKNRGS